MGNSPRSTFPAQRGFYGTNGARNCFFISGTSSYSHAYTEGRLRAFQSVNIHMTATYWKIGHDIVEYEQGGQAKAGYGKALLANLSPISPCFMVGGLAAAIALYAAFVPAISNKSEAF